MPTTTGSSSRHCQYFIRNQEDKVKIEVFNGTNEVNQPYSVTLTSSKQNINFNTSVSVLLIPFITLKPCENYTVSVNPDCIISSGSNTIMWKPFCPEFCSDIFENVAKLNWTNNRNVCFGNKMCLQSDDSCSQTFTGTSCIGINLPLSDKPMFNFEHNKAILRWENRNDKCNETIKFSCNDLNDKTMTENGMYKPYHNYSCVAMYPFLTKYISSESFPITFTCDWNGSYFPDLKPNYTDIKASWVHMSSNCDKNQIHFNIECEHNGDTRKCRWNDTSCTISGLNYGTKYTCNINAFYNATNFNHTTKTVETLSDQPDIKYNAITRHGNNGFIVRYKVDWKGPKGECELHLKIGQKVDIKRHNAEKDECVFDLGDLYYLTYYKFEVYAINGKGNKSNSYKGSYTTHFNDRAVLGFLGFFIAVTTLALLFVMYKIFVLQRKPSSGDRCELDPLHPTEMLLHVEPIGADALIETYRKKIADDGRLFMEEFQSIPRIFSNYTVKEAKKSENQSKNRYVDILPYDYNRVALCNGGKHDYINASFIEGYKEPNKYIAAQGPKDETVEDFWRMVWEQKSSIIVMVTHCEEGNKSKCAQYWPSVERETELFDDFVVKIKHEKICPDYIVRQLSLMNRKEKAAERDVTHIQFVSWPDHGVPNEPSLLLKLRRRVNSFKNVFSGPIVVHCSAGVGRTGTYIGIDAMIESLEAEGRMDIYGYVAKLRRQRCLMVQVEAQYVLIHTALIEYNQFGETEISLASLHSTVNTLKQKEGNEPSLMDLEFQKLPKFKNWRPTNTAVAEENQKRNRSSVVPYDFNRVMIKLEEDEGHNSNNDDEDDYSSDEDDETCTKYINASYVDGYWSPRSLIAAQGPLTSTVEDFLQMIHQKQVPAVFMLTDCMENGKEFCTQYWAEEKTVFGEMEVEVEDTEITPTYIRRRLQIQSTKAKGSVRTEQYHFLKWAGLALPANPVDLIDMMKITMQKSGHSNSRDNTNTPIVVHCQDGSSRSGIFCALWKLLFSGDTEKLVDVFQVVKGLRKDRLGMISTLEQYQFIYEALQAAFPVQNGEVKKTAAIHDSVQVINEEGCTASANQQEAAKSQAPETDAVPEAVIASPYPEEGTTESSCVPEKSPSESTTNGPTVTVEV